MAEVLPLLRDAMCSGETNFAGLECESGAFRLDVTRRRRTARLYFVSQYISVTLLAIVSLANVKCCATADARLRRGSASRVAICNGELNVGDIC